MDIWINSHANQGKHNSVQDPKGCQWLCAQTLVPLSEFTPAGPCWKSLIVNGLHSLPPSWQPPSCTHVGSDNWLAVLLVSCSFFCHGRSVRGRCCLLACRKGVIIATGHISSRVASTPDRDPSRVEWAFSRGKLNSDNQLSRIIKIQRVVDSNVY